MKEILCMGVGSYTRPMGGGGGCVMGGGGEGDCCEGCGSGKWSSACTSPSPSLSPVSTVRR